MLNKNIDGVDIPMTEEEEAAHLISLPSRDEILKKALRQERDILLTQSDWTQVADAPVDKAAWATYRQALRDIPQQGGFPTTVTWPVKP